MFCRQQSSKAPGAPLTAGFLAFARLCRIAGKIQRLNSPRNIRVMLAADPARLQRYTNRVAAHDRMLRMWLDTLPAEIRFSANTAEWKLDGNPHLTMCVIMLIVHSGSLLNLYRYVSHLCTRVSQPSASLNMFYINRCFVGGPKQSPLLADAPNATDAIAQCRTAAQSCISAAELVRDLVQPSHYLAICVHYLTVSGIML